MTKLNYLFSLLCMLAISTFVFAQPANDLCADAIDLSSSLGQGLGTAINAGTYDNTDATTTGDPTAGYDCFGEPDGNGDTPSLEQTVWFKITGDGNNYSFEATTANCNVSNGITENDTQIAVYTDGCGTLTPVACNEDGPNISQGSFPSLIEFTAEAGVEYLIMVDGFNFEGSVSVGEFCMIVTQRPPAPANDLCVNAIDLNSSTGQGEGTVVNAGTYTNVSATTSDDPAAGFDCLLESDGMGSMPSLDNTIWFTITGDGNDYILEATVTDCSVSGGIPGNDTQIVVYTGECGDLTSVACNDDGPDAGDGNFPSLVEFTAEAGVEYSILVDGYGGVVGDFCLFFTQQTNVGVLEVNEDVLGMTVFPNPVQDLINLNINTAEYKDAVIMVTNVMGQTIHQQAANLQSGMNTLSIDLKHAPAGVYMISVETDSHQSVNRFMKQ